MEPEYMIIYCVGCGHRVDARLTTGKEIFPTRADLAERYFWKCDGCDNHVGTHYKGSNPTDPLGVISTKAIRNARSKIHDVLDPLWQSGRIDRITVYQQISRQIGRKYHTADIKTMEEARNIYKIVGQIHNSIVGGIDLT